MYWGKYSRCECSLAFCYSQSVCNRHIFVWHDIPKNDNIDDVCIVYKMTDRVVSNKTRVVYVIQHGQECCKWLVKQKKL